MPTISKILDFQTPVRSTSCHLWRYCLQALFINILFYTEQHEYLNALIRYIKHTMIRSHIIAN